MLLVNLKKPYKSYMYIRLRRIEFVFSQTQSVFLLRTAAVLFHKFFINSTTTISYSELGLFSQIFSDCSNSVVIVKGSGKRTPPITILIQQIVFHIRQAMIVKTSFSIWKLFKYIKTCYYQSVRSQFAKSESRPDTTII